jgi:redox-regulated HSP33 family molecular chaperone
LYAKFPHFIRNSEQRTTRVKIAAKFLFLKNLPRAAGFSLAEK